MKSKSLKKIVLVFLILVIILLLIDLVTSKINGSSLINFFPCLSKNC
ncbi:MAG: hypothetical protein QW641_00830 [Candidatus Aenigmatarchaeota archaeon]